MKNPLVLLGRALSLHRHRSHIPTGFTPLSKVKRVMVVMDADEPSAGECVKEVGEFFARKGISCDIYAFSRLKQSPLQQNYTTKETVGIPADKNVALSNSPAAVTPGTTPVNSKAFSPVLLTKRNLNWFGRPRRDRRSPKVSFDQELFVNLFPETTLFAADYCARCSKASFKIGRTPTKDKLYDLLVNSDGYTQADVFRQLIPLLESVR